MTYKLIIGRRSERKIWVERKFPHKTGAVKDLYKTDGVATDDEHWFENYITNLIDTRAAAVLSFMTANGIQNITDEQRNHWTQFLTSLAVRDPLNVVALKDTMVAQRRAITDVWESKYALVRGPSSPETEAQLMAARDPGGGHKSAFLMLTELINDGRFAADLAKMHWRTIDLSMATNSFVLSDYALERNDFNLLNVYVALPIGPKLLFVAARSSDWLQRIPQGDPDVIIAHMNESSVERARQYFWAFDGSHRSLADRLMGLSPKPIFLEQNA